MTEYASVDELQYGASVRRRGLRSRWLGFELVQLVARDDQPPSDVFCTAGCNGAALILNGSLRTKVCAAGSIDSRSSGRLRVIRAHEFTSHQLSSRTAWLIVIRIGIKRSRYRLIEMVGAQVSSVIVEVAQRRLATSPPQVVISSTEDDSTEAS